MATKRVEEVNDITIRFSGDSGDGMQLTGMNFTETTALVGNDVSTLPDYPAEIRAPAGTLAGVSGFQVHFSSRPSHAPSDYLDALVAMNPAALKNNIGDVLPNGLVIINSDSFKKANLVKAEYLEDPLPDLRERFQVIEIAITKLTREALKDIDLSSKEKDRCKNIFALGLTYWLYNRPMEFTQTWLNQKFGKNQAVLEANLTTLNAGYFLGETLEALPVSYVIHKAKIEPGTYRNIMGNQATAMGIAAAGHLMECDVVLGAYPITPATDILQELAKYKHFGVKTFQAEDEIAAAGIAVGASFAGKLGVCTTSGPGYVLKQEIVNLAVMTELPLVLIDVQRGGPSTGLPTKVEQSDLLLALYGRNSDSPMPVLAPSSPGDCFTIVLEAFRLAVKYMTPVTVLSDGYLANSSEPWKLPEIESLVRAPVKHHKDAETFSPYKRDPETLARPWAPPGTAGCEHRIGGIEKDYETGDVSYDNNNHHKMMEVRAAKIAGMVRDIPDLEINGPESGKLLIVGWGNTEGAINEAIKEAREEGMEVSSIHLRHLNPFPANLGEILKGFERIVVPELNMGQLVHLLRSEFLVPAERYSKVAGRPLRVHELLKHITDILKDEA